MGADTATDTTWNVVTMGPYVAAAAALLGPTPAGADNEARMHEVVALARQVALTTAQSIPIRMATVRGVLSVAEKQNNPHRTKLAVDTSQSKYGEDEMWTDYESGAAAKRTRAALVRHAGRRVQATKVTVLEFYPDGRAVPGEKGGQQTRTRLEPGSLVLIDDQNEVVGAIDLTAEVQQAGPQRAPAQRPATSAPTRPAAGTAAAGAAKSAMVDAAQSFQRLVERRGADGAAAAWGELPRTGSIPRARLEQLAAEHGLTDAQPARAAA